MIKINDEIVANESYPNGETIFKSFRLAEYYSIEVKYESDKDLFALIMYVKHIKSLNTRFSIEMSYIPYSRMDREIDGYIYSLKYFSEILNDLGCTIYALDCHSDKCDELIKKLNTILPEHYISAILDSNNYDFICFPDKGAYNRYNNVDFLKDFKLIYCNKERDLSTGRIKNMSLNSNGHDIKGKNILIVDDLCSYGGTFMGCADLLVNGEGANNVDLYISHCEKSIFKGKILSENLINKVYTTQSIIQEEKSDKLIIL